MKFLIFGATVHCKMTIGIVPCDTTTSRALIGLAMIEHHLTQSYVCGSKLTRLDIPAICTEDSQYMRYCGSA